MSDVSEALEVLNARLTAADSIVGALYEAGGENPPSWVSLFFSQIQGLQEAASDLEQALQPHHVAFDALGYGGTP